MTVCFERLYRDADLWGEGHGIQVRDYPLPAGQAGKFDGLTITMNRSYCTEERTYYLLHAIGSIVRWSQNKPSIDELFEQLRTAKSRKEFHQMQLERAIERYHGFEEESSGVAVWLIAELGCIQAVGPYTNFMPVSSFDDRVPPTWQSSRLARFFLRWNEEVMRGIRQVTPFHPLAVQAFCPIEIDKQEILQEQDDGSN